MAVIFRDEFSGFSAASSSGSAPFTATDNTEQVVFFDFEGTPSTGDKVEYKMTFSSGDVSFIAEWTSSTTLVLKRTSTIPGTSNGTATLQTFSGASTSKPRSDGDTVRMGFTVNRGAVNASTTITFKWHGRSNFSAAAQTTDNFNVDGEVTPTAATYTITGSSFRNRDSLDGRSPDTTGGGTYTWDRSLGSDKQSGATILEQYDPNGVVAENDFQPVRSSESPPVDVMYGIAGGMSLDTMTVRATAVLDSGEFAVLNLGAKWDAAAKSGLIMGFFAPDFVVVGSYTTGSYDGDYDSAATASPLDDGLPHDFEFIVDDATQTAQVRVDGVDLFTPALDISFGAGSLLGPAAAGIGMWRSGRDIAGISVSEFEVDDTADIGGSSPCDDPGGGPFSSATDDFTGSAGDITGRALDNGTWCGPSTGSTGTLETDGSGKLIAPTERETDAYYTVLGLGRDSYKVTVNGQFDVAGGWISVMSRWLPGLSGYEAVLGGNGVLQLYRAIGGSYVSLSTVSVIIDTGQPVTLVLDSADTGFHRVYYQNKLVMTAVDDTYLTGGSPGVNIGNAASGSIPTVFVTDWTMEDSDFDGGGFGTGTPPAGDASTTVTIDHFTGVPDVDIDGRTPDGKVSPSQTGSCYEGPSAGVWVKVPTVDVGSVETAVPATHDIQDPMSRILKGEIYEMDIDGDVTSVDVRLWSDVEDGDLYLLIGHTRIGSLHPTVPSGWTEVVNQDNGSFQGHLVVASKEVDGSEGATVTVPLTGTPSFATERTNFISLAVRQGTVLNVTSVDTWLSQQDFGPISGLASTNDSCLIAIGAKQETLNGTVSGNYGAILTANNGFEVVGYASSSYVTPGPTPDGPQSSIVAAFKYAPGGASAQDCTITDHLITAETYTSEGAGMGVMLEIGLDTLPDTPGVGVVASRANPTDDFWPAFFSHISPMVLTDIPALVGADQYMVEGSFTCHLDPQAEVGSDVSATILALYDPQYRLGFGFTYEFNTGFCSLRKDGPGFGYIGTYGPPTAPGTPVKLRLTVDGTVGNGISHFGLYVNDLLVGEASVLFDAFSWPIDADPFWPGFVLFPGAPAYGTGRLVDCDYIRVATDLDSPYPPQCSPTDTHGYAFRNFHSCQLTTGTDSQGLTQYGIARWADVSGKGNHLLAGAATTIDDVEVFQGATFPGEPLDQRWSVRFYGPNALFWPPTMLSGLTGGEAVIVARRRATLSIDFGQYGTIEDLEADGWAVSGDWILEAPDVKFWSDKIPKLGGTDPGTLTKPIGGWTPGATVKVNWRTFTLAFDNPEWLNIHPEDLELTADVNGVIDLELALQPPQDDIEDLIPLDGVIMTEEAPIEYTGLWRLGADGADDTVWPLGTGDITENFGRNLAVAAGEALVSLEEAFRYWDTRSSLTEFVALVDNSQQVTTSGATTGWSTAPLVGRSGPLGPGDVLVDAIAVFNRVLTPAERPLVILALKNRGLPSSGGGGGGGGSGSIVTGKRMILWNYLQPLWGTY